MWLQSITTLLSVIDDLDRQIAPIERELRPLAHGNEQVRLLMTIPGVAELLGLTLLAEIGEISRFPTARRLVGYSGLAPTVKQSGQSSRTGPLSKAGPSTLRWAAIEAAQGAWRPTNPWHRLYSETKQRHGGVESRQGGGRAQGPDRLLARPRAQRTLQAERRERYQRCPGKLLHSSGRLKAHERSEKPGQLQPDQVRTSAERDLSSSTIASTRKETPTDADSA